MNRNFFSMQRNLLGLLCATLLALTGCMADGTANTPDIPEKLNRNGDGVPVLDVYDVDSDKVEEMDVETYVMGVVAGEVRAVAQAERRILECQRLGFDHVLLPKSNMRNLNAPEGMRLIGVETVSQAIGALGLFDD